MTATTGPIKSNSSDASAETKERRRPVTASAADTNGDAARANDETPLAWLSSILWPAGDAELKPADQVSDTEHHEQTWWASPSAEAAEILIPAELASAQTAVRRYHDGFSLKKRARSWAAEATMHVPGLADRMLGSNLVAVDGPRSDRTLDLLEQLSELLNEPGLRAAITLARPKSNRKPVLQLIARDGTERGWAKIGWTNWTASLIGNEADWLSKDSVAPLIKPVLLHDLELCGHRVVVTSGVMGSRRPRRGTSDSPNIELVAAIAAMGTSTTSPVTGTPWWGSVTDVLTSAEPAEATAIQATVEHVADRLVAIGAWHGDLTPWNIITAQGRDGGGLQVIDWEFAADGVPLGFDICHFHTQVGAELRGMDPDEALDYSARRSPQDLAALGVDPDNQIATWQLYLVELIRRTLALRQAGFGTENVHQGRAAVRRLTRIHQADQRISRN